MVGGGGRHLLHRNPIRYNVVHEKVGSNSMNQKRMCIKMGGDVGRKSQ